MLGRSLHAVREKISSLISSIIVDGKPRDCSETPHTRQNDCGEVLQWRMTTSTPGPTLLIAGQDAASSGSIMGDEQVFRQINATARPDTNQDTTKIISLGLTRLLVSVTVVSGNAAGAKLQQYTIGTHLNL